MLCQGGALTVLGPCLGCAPDQPIEGGPAAENDGWSGTATDTGHGDVYLLLEDLPELVEVDGWVVVEVDDGGPLILIRQDEIRIATLRSTCTHQACPVQWSAAVAALACTCHGSNFSLDGEVLRGPATEPLDLISTTFDGVEIVLHFSHDLPDPPTSR